MKNIAEVIEDIRKIKSESSPAELTEYLVRLDGEYWPSSIMLDKARAIQLHEGNEYTLDDAKNIMETILKIEPDYIPAYLEMGYFHYVIMNDSESAIDVFDKGISKAQQLLDELLVAKTEALKFN